MPRSILAKELKSDLIFVSTWKTYSFSKIASNRIQWPSSPPDLPEVFDTSQLPLIDYG